MFCSYRISTDKLSHGPSAIAEFLVIQYRSVTDRHTETHTDRQTHDDGIYRASIALVKMDNLPILDNDRYSTTFAITVHPYHSLYSQ